MKYMWASKKMLFEFGVWEFSDPLSLGWWDLAKMGRDKGSSDFAEYSTWSRVQGLGHQENDQIPVAQ